jgi:hypothetical protein
MNALQYVNFKLEDRVCGRLTSVASSVVAPSWLYLAVEEAEMLPYLLNYLAIPLGCPSIWTTQTVNCAYRCPEYLNGHLRHFGDAFGGCGYCWTCPRARVASSASPREERYIYKTDAHEPKRRIKRILYSIYVMKGGAKSNMLFTHEAATPLSTDFSSGIHGSSMKELIQLCICMVFIVQNEAENRVIFDA